MNRRNKGLILPVAELQFGLFSVSQARAAGVPRSVLQRACAAGDLRRVMRGVYALAGHPVSRWEPHIAVGLAVGPDGALSHESAAAVHGFDLVVTKRTEITLMGGLTKRRFPGTVLHRSQCLSMEDVVEKRGVLVTSPARTLLDLSARLEEELVERVLDEGLIGRRWSMPEIAGALRRVPSNFPSRSHLERLVSLRVESPVADSLLEARLVPVICGIEGFGPAVVHHQLVVFGSVYVVDAAWPHLRVAVEVAGRAHRVASRGSFDKERRKFNALAAAGWQVAHVTAGMTDQEIVRDVKRLLARAASQDRPAGW